MQLYTKCCFKDQQHADDQQLKEKLSKIIITYLIFFSIGMSTVPEAIAARHCGMEVLGMSMVTNACIMENDIEQKTDHQEVLETGKRQGESMCKLISKIVEKMDHKEQNGA